MDKQQDKVEQWNSTHVWIMLIGVAISLFDGRLDILFGITMLSFLRLFFLSKETLLSFKPFGGYCNWVTFLRLLMLGGFCLFYSTDSNKFFLGLMVSVISLDWIDGYLARKYNHSSFFGQYFDMETDAFFVLMMCCFYYLYRDIPEWILIPGLMRYVYKIGIDLFPKEDFKESKKQYASTIAGLFFVILCSGMLLEGALLKYSLALGSAMITISFGISIMEYIRFESRMNQAT